MREADKVGGKERASELELYIYECVYHAGCVSGGGAQNRLRRLVTRATRKSRCTHPHRCISKSVPVSSEVRVRCADIQAAMERETGICFVLFLLLCCVCGNRMHICADVSIGEG